MVAQFLRLRLSAARNAHRRRPTQLIGLLVGALATALIHSPKVLVLDEPFEAVDPVSVSSVVNILRQFAAAGGAVVLSSHSLGLIEDLCDEVAVIVEGRVIAAGTVDDVRGDDTLENRFIALVRDDDPAEDMEWLHTFSA